MVADLSRLTVATWKLPDHSISQIERLTIDQDIKAETLARLKKELKVGGLFYLATCQRVLVCFLRSEQMRDLGMSVKVAFGKTLGFSEVEAFPGPAIQSGENALRHIARVATSLDSFVLGEPQVLGQFRAAYGFCVEQRLLDPDIDWVLSRVIRAAKRIRTETDLFRGKVSTIPLTLDILHEALDDRPSKSVAVVGSGNMGSKFADLVARKFPGAVLHLVSRSRDRAANWARSCEGVPWSLGAFLKNPPPLDILLFASGATKPFFDADSAARFSAASRENGRTLLTMIDLGLPRNCSPDVAEVDGCRLMQMQDLAMEAERGKTKRSDAEKEARAILDEELNRMLHCSQIQDLERLVGSLRQDIVDAGKERLSQLPPALEPALSSDPAFIKWYEQSLKTVAHVSMMKTRKIVEEVGGYDRG